MYSKNNNSNYDISIVGSGPAGSFVASELARSGINVALIEAGGNNLDARIDNVVDTEISKINGNIDFGLSQQIGGSSNLWSGGLARFYSIDLIERKKFGFNGWPTNTSELELLYKRVNQLIGIPSNNRSKKSDKKELVELDNTNFEEREMIVLNNPYRAHKLIENQQNIKFFSKCMVKKFNIDENNNVSSLEVYDKKKKKFFKIFSKKYILAAGALTNIRLMKYSLQNHKDNFCDLYNNIGRYFSTHPKANIGYVKLYNPLSSKHPFISQKSYSSFISRFQFGLSKDFLLKHNLLNHCVRFDSPYNQRLNKLFDLIKHRLGRSSLFNANEGYFAEKIANLGVLIYKFINEAGFFKSKANILSVRIFMDQSASKNNKIELSNKISESGLPLASINWKFDEENWINVDKFMNFFGNELKKLDIGELIYHRPRDKDFTGIHSHFIGGTRCGVNELTSVVDNDLKVHKIGNLFISGPSVFPSFGYTNPFYTIAALSLRLADHLKSLINKK